MDTLRLKVPIRPDLTFIVIVDAQAGWQELEAANPSGDVIYVLINRNRPSNFPRTHRYFHIRDGWRIDVTHQGALQDLPWQEEKPGLLRDVTRTLKRRFKLVGEEFVKLFRTLREGINNAWKGAVSALFTAFGSNCESSPGCLDRCSASFRSTQDDDTETSDDEEISHTVHVNDPEPPSEGEAEGGQVEESRWFKRNPKHNTDGPADCPEIGRKRRRANGVDEQPSGQTSSLSVPADPNLSDTFQVNYPEPPSPMTDEGEDEGGEVETSMGKSIKEAPNEKWMADTARSQGVRRSVWNCFAVEVP
ncbi:hypothetical protein DL98DRAFT_598884 [Cadophora sp. DSE1049]|nr:hypothetical protein DL98DRAFT_598884 [Cadophora sp. DSE1049]